MTRHYRPANGSEGADFQDYFCSRCERDRAFRETDYEGDPALGCKILADTFCFDVDDPNYPKEWIEDDEKGPRCTAFTTDPTLPERCPNTPDLFAISSTHQKDGA